MATPESVRSYIQKRVGFLPQDAYGWLYACRGLYQLKEYAFVIEGLSNCLRQEETMKEALHLLAFSLLHTQQNKAAAAAFYKSIQAGNDTDWQPLIELCLEHPSLQLQAVPR